MTTASPAAPDLKQVTARYRDGLRRLLLTVAAYPSLQNESCFSQFRQKTASLNDQVKEVRSRCGEIQNLKTEFQRLQKELQKRFAELKTAETNLEALSQIVGEAAFRESIAGRLSEFPALHTRREIQRQIDELSQEKLQVDQAAHSGFTDTAKRVARSTALSGRVLLLKQKVASADKALGSAVLELKQEELVLTQADIDILTKVREARKAIVDCEENLTVAKRQLDDCRSHAAAIGIVEVDDAHFDAEYKKEAERLLAIECDRLSVRWDLGRAIISTHADALPENLRQLAAELSQLASEHPEACQKPTLDTATVIADLKAQVSLLHENAGTIIFKNRLFKDTLSVEFGKVSAAPSQKRTALLRQLGKAAFSQPDPLATLKNEPTILAISTEVNAIRLTIKEVDGAALIGTDGKAAPPDLYPIVAGFGFLAAVVLACCGILTFAVNKSREFADSGRSSAASPPPEIQTADVREPFSATQSQQPPSDSVTKDLHGPNGEDVKLWKDEDGSFRHFYIDKDGREVRHGTARTKFFGTLGSQDSLYDSGVLLQRSKFDGEHRLTMSYRRLPDGNFERDEYRRLSNGSTVQMRSVITITKTDSGESHEVVTKPQLVSDETPLPLVSGRSVKVNVGTAGIDKMQCAVLLRPKNASLSSVKCVATADQIVIDFNVDGSKWTKEFAAFPILVRLFDKNGNHLHHFTTAEKFTAFVEVFEGFDSKYRDFLQAGSKEHATKWKAMLLKPKGNRLIYSINVRDLRDASMVEVGFTEP